MFSSRSFARRGSSPFCRQTFLSRRTADGCFQATASLICSMIASVMLIKISKMDQKYGCMFGDARILSPERSKDALERERAGCNSQKRCVVITFCLL